MARIFLTGATGFVGSHVLPALLGAGHSVVALVRNDARASALQARVAASPGRLETRIGHVNDRPSLEAALLGCDAVGHLVALPRDWSDGADLERVNEIGRAHV